MKNSIYSSLITLGLLCLLSCEKNNPSDLFYYDETGCSDVWWNGAPSYDTLTPQIYQDVVSSYLEDKNIELISFSIDYDSTKAEFCLGCICKTGAVLQVEVKSGRKQKMRRIGFYP